MAQDRVDVGALHAANESIARIITAALDRNVAAILTNTVEVIRALKELRGESLDEKTVMQAVQKAYIDMLGALGHRV
jgi:hypothetical protein